MPKQQNKPKLTKSQERVILVLSRISQQVADSEDDAEVWVEELENVLTNMLSNDFFGSEGQNDPRGDFKETEWSMSKVEGIDSKKVVAKDQI